MVSSRSLIIAVVIVGLLMVAGWITVAMRLKHPHPQIITPTIAVTIYPLYDIVRNIALPDDAVDLIVQPGTNPATYRPTAQDKHDLKPVKLVFMVGHGLDDWAGTLTANSVTVDNNINVMSQDPHYWLSLKNAKIITQNIVDALSRFDPPHAPAFRERAVKYDQELDELYQYGLKYHQVSSVSAIPSIYLAQDFDLTLATSSGNEVNAYGGSINTDTYLTLMKSNLDAVFK